VRGTSRNVCSVVKFSIKNDYTSGSVVSPCRHSLTRPQIADGETASSMEGSCEHIE